MKYAGKKSICGILAACLLPMLLCTTVLARSSAYLDAYSATVTPQSGGKMAVTVTVSGVGTMTKIGATTIYIYESSDNQSFTKVATYDYEDYPGMMGSGTFYCDTPVTYSGKVGNYYLASVYCYAANASGSDEKNYTTVAKQARAYVPGT